jgi:hypothetical protein
MKISQQPVQRSWRGWNDECTPRTPMHTCKYAQINGILTWEWIVQWYARIPFFIHTTLPRVSSTRHAGLPQVALQKTGFPHAIHFWPCVYKSQNYLTSKSSCIQARIPEWLVIGLCCQHEPMPASHFIDLSNMSRNLWWWYLKCQIHKTRKTNLTKSSIMGETIEFRTHA